MHYSRGLNIDPGDQIPNPELCPHGGLNMKDYTCSHVSAFEGYKDRWQSNRLRLGRRLEVNDRENSQRHWTTSVKYSNLKTESLP